MKLIKYILVSLALTFFTQESNAQCTASFSMVDSGLTKAFTSLSTATPAITSYSWSFGDGATSTLANPTHTYSTIGNYLVQLTISNGFCTNSTSWSINACRLQTSFTSSSSGLTTTFTNTSSGLTATSTYLWSFGDGNTSSLTNPTHTYATAGSYSVGLEVYDTTSGSYCFDSVYNYVTLGGCPLTANFYDSTSGMTSQFFSNISGASGTVSYFWNFGDGATSTSINPTHTYSSAGAFNVSLTVTDTSGCSVIITNIVGCNLTANYTHSSTGLTTTFTNTSTGLSSVAYYLWRFGDGNTSNLQNPVHTYATAGTYYPVFIVYDSLCSDSAYSTSVSVSGSGSGCPITASFTPSSSGLTTSFVNTSTGATPGANYLWYFGDGNTSTLQNPVHTYATAGTYFVDFRIFDSSLMCQDTALMTITLTSSSGCPLVASYTQSSSGLTANFVNTTSGITSTPLYMWHFGDGSPTVTTTNANHTYASAGTYNVDLMVFDSSGCSDTAYSTIVVVGTSAGCHINASFVETITGLSVGFNSTTTSSLSLPLIYNWHFGDGTLGTGATTSHSYSSTGVYSVTITASDSLCSDSNTRIIAVSSNVFTPNGDGIDDVFPLPCSGSAAAVYNTSGLLIKTLAPSSTSWDGTNNLGGAEPTGLYFIVCTGSSTPIPVTLIR